MFTQNLIFNSSFFLLKRKTKKKYHIDWEINYRLTTWIWLIITIIYLINNFSPTQIKITKTKKIKKNPPPSLHCIQLSLVQIIPSSSSILFVHCSFHLLLFIVHKPKSLTSYFLSDTKNHWTINKYHNPSLSESKSPF